MIEILEGIARDPDAYPSARVSALRELKRISDAEPEQERSAFDALDTDELAARRRAAAQRERKRR